MLLSVVWGSDSTYEGLKLVHTRCGRVLPPRSDSTYEGLKRTTVLIVTRSPKVPTVPMRA